MRPGDGFPILTNDRMEDSRGCPLHVGRDWLNSWLLVDPLVAILDRS